MGVTSRPRGCVLHNTTSAVSLTECWPGLHTPSKKKKKTLVKLHKEAAEGGLCEDSMSALQHRLI